MIDKQKDRKTNRQRHKQINRDKKRYRCKRQGNTDRHTEKGRRENQTIWLKKYYSI